MIVRGSCKIIALQFSESDMPTTSVSRLCKDEQEPKQRLAEDEGTERKGYGSNTNTLYTWDSRRIEETEVLHTCIEVRLLLSSASMCKRPSQLVSRESAWATR